LKKDELSGKYPDLSDEMIEVLEKSDRKMECQQYDLKIDTGLTTPKEPLHTCPAGKTPLIGFWRKTGSLPPRAKAWRMPQSML